jgi:hypothetical protein
MGAVAVLGENYAAYLRNRGISLQGYGVREYALRKGDAVEAVGLLQAARVPILGGDVWTVDGSNVQPTGDSWYSDLQAGEHHDDFVRRSASHSLNYIEAYSRTSPESVFVLVPRLAIDRA